MGVRNTAHVFVELTYWGAHVALLIEHAAFVHVHVGCREGRQLFGREVWIVLFELQWRDGWEPSMEVDICPSGTSSPSSAGNAGGDDDVFQAKRLFELFNRPRALPIRLERIVAIAAFNDCDKTTRDSLMPLSASIIA